MAAMGTYDTNLHMFVQGPRDIDMNQLAFMRWLAEAGRLEQQVAGPSCGSLAEQQKLRENADARVAA